MDNAFDVKKMLEEGAKKFELSLAQMSDIEDSDDEYPVMPSIVNKSKEEDTAAICSVDVFSTKVEGHKGKEISFNDVYVEMRTERDAESIKSSFKKELVNDAKKKSVIGAGFEKLESLPPYEISKRKLLQERQKKRESTKGENWFNMPVAEVTEEIKHDLQLLKMRSVLDPKQFYKKNVLKDVPKYFHVGTVVESPADFYSSRIPKKQRKQTMVDELLADAEFQSYNKQRYKEIIEDRRKTSFKAHRHACRLKRKGKSRK